MAESADQLLELLLQLKKTTPAAAKTILNAQPTIAYALIALMVSMNAVDYEVFQKTLSDYATQSQVVATPKPHPIANPPPPVPYSQPPSNYPPPPAANGYPTYYQHQPPPQQHMYQQQPPHQQHSNYPSYVAPGPSPYLPAPPKPSPAPAATLPPSLAHLPEEQKSMVLHILSLTPEAIAQLGPGEQANIRQLRATLGL